MESSLDVDDFFIDMPKEKQQNKISKIKQFFFPPDQFLTYSFNNISQVQVVMKSNQEGLFNFRRKRRGNYEYFSCHHCNAKISFCCKQQKLRIVHFQNHHVHKLTKHKSLQQKMVIDLLCSMEKLQTPSQTKQRIMNIVPINQRRYNYILSKNLDKNCYSKVRQHLQANNYQVRIQHKQTNQIPQLLLIMSRKMQKWIWRFNEVFTFDVTYHLLKNKSNQNRKWGVGIFTTFNSNLEIVPVAYAIILREDTYHFATLFSGFLELVNTKTCTFITDQQRSIRSALNLLKQNGTFQGNHVFDDFHLLRNLKSKVGSQYPLYHQLITTKNIHKFNAIFQKLLEETQYTAQLHQIQQNKQKMCYSQGLNKFVGLSFSSSRGEKCNDLIKTILPKESNLFRLVMAFQKLQYKISLRKPKYVTKKYEILFSDLRILQIRQCVQQKIFNVFITNYVVGLKAAPEPIQGTCFYVVNGFKTQGSDCQCGINIKSGIPCSHMLAVLSRFTKSSYKFYFNIRWLNNDKKQQSSMQKGSRNSRRRKK